jgi:hypothetical protein
MVLLRTETCAGIRRVRGVSNWALVRETGSTPSRLNCSLRKRTVKAFATPWTSLDRDPPRLWPSTSRIGFSAKRRHPSPAGPLGYRGPRRQGQPRSYRSHADLGEGRRRQVVDSCTGDYWTSLQSRQSSRNSLGSRHLRERRLVCGSRVRSASGTGSFRTS